MIRLQIFRCRRFDCGTAGQVLARCLAAAWQAPTFENGSALQDFSSFTALFGVLFRKVFSKNPLPSHYPQKTRQEKTVSAHAGKSPNRRTAQVSGTGHLLSQTTNDFAAGLPNVQDYIGVREGASGQRAGETGMLIPVFAGSSGAAPYL